MDVFLNFILLVDINPFFTLQNIFLKSPQNYNHSDSVILLQYLKSNLITVLDY